MIEKRIPALAAFALLFLRTIASPMLPHPVFR